MKFSLLHPSRSRPHKSFQTTQDWLNYATGKDFELIVSIDESDPYKEQYQRIYGNYNQYKTRLIINNNHSAVEAINNAAKVSEGEILIVVSDDTGVLKGWDKVIEQAVGTHKDFVLKVYDGIQDWIVTMPIMDRAYYERFGYIYYPEYQHMFCLHPDTPIFMGDFTFKRIGDIKPGDCVIGTSGAKREKLVRTIVTETHNRVSDLFELTLESGKKLYSTIDHRWGYYDGNRMIKYGTPKIGRRLKKIIDLPGAPPTGMDFERGWLSGMWDGEGSFDVLTQSINHNPDVCKNIERILDQIGLKYSVTHQSSKRWENSTQRVYTLNGGRNEYIKMLNWLNPVKKVTPRSDKRLLSSRYGTPDTIVSIKSVGDSEVVCLTTGTSNFIADGYLSHNCDTHLTHVADALSRLIIRNDILIPHEHYSIKKADKDEVTRKADSTFKAGMNVYFKMLRENLGLEPSVNIWDLSRQAKSHINWYNNNPYK